MIKFSLRGRESIAKGRDRLLWFGGLVAKAEGNGN